MINGVWYYVLDKTWSKYGKWFVQNN
jgi:hypothetical protein